MTERVPHSRAWPIIAAVAATLTVAGAVITIIALATPVTFGWFAYQPLADSTFVPGDTIVVSRAVIPGVGLVIVGLIVLSFLAGRRSGIRSRPGALSDATLEGPA